MWTLTEAVKFCQKLDLHVRAVGYSVGLAGSVLFIGSSKKDLDLIVFPLNALELNLHALYTALRSAGLRPSLSEQEVKAHWLIKGSTDTKHVEVWRYGVRRVDLFILK